MLEDIRLLELELEVIGSHLTWVLGADQVLWKSSMNSYLLIHLFSPQQPLVFTHIMLLYVHMCTQTHMEETICCISLLNSASDLKGADVNCVD